jgi:hypothetical protein
MSAEKGRIRDAGYQRYRGGYTPEAGRWALIAGRMLRQGARQPWVIVMLILAIFPLLIGGVLMYLKVKLISPHFPVEDPNHFVYYIAVKPYGGLLLGFMTALFAGGGAIADDARTEAFPFYFARPVTRDQYLAGKLVPVAVLTAIPAAGPSVLLALLRLSLASDGNELLHALPLPLAATALGAIEALALALPVVALSSLSRGRGYAQGAFAALFLLPWIAGGILVEVLRSPWPALLSLPADLDSVARLLIGVRIEPGDRVVPAWAALAALGAVAAASLVLVRRRLAAVTVAGA